MGARGQAPRPRRRRPPHRPRGNQCRVCTGTSRGAGPSTTTLYSLAPKRITTCQHSRYATPTCHSEPRPPPGGRSEQSPCARSPWLRATLRNRTQAKERLGVVRFGRQVGAGPRARPSDPQVGAGPRARPSDPQVGAGPRARPSDPQVGAGPRARPSDPQVGAGPRARPSDPQVGAGPRARPPMLCRVIEFGQAQGPAPTRASPRGVRNGPRPKDPSISGAQRRPTLRMATLWGLRQGR